MAKKFLTDIDLSQNELQNLGLQLLGSAPSSPVQGQVYYNTTTNTIEYYNGTAWEAIGTSSASGTVTSVSVTSANGFAGTVANPGSTPAITLETTVTGLLKGNGTSVSAATSGSDYAPATSGTSALAGNGSGGFTSATLNDVGAPTAAYSVGNQNLTNVADPTSAQDAATKNYVDSTAQGLDAKPSVAALSAVNVTLSGTQTVDGVSLAVAQRVLLTAQTTASQNGIWVVASGAWTRPTDFASGSTQVGAYVFVEAGTTYGSSGWVLSGDTNVTVDTTSETWVQFSTAGTVTAGTGLTKTGNTIALTTPVSIADGGTGADTLPSGLLKGAGTGAIAAAVSGTDYAPATSGSLILKGNGSGGFSNAKYTGSIGNGSSTSIAVSDGLGTIDKIAIVRDATTGAQVECDITYSATQTTFGFTVAPASNAYDVVIIG